MTREEREEAQKRYETMKNDAFNTKMTEWKLPQCFAAANSANDVPALLRALDEAEKKIEVMACELSGKRICDRLPKFHTVTLETPWRSCAEALSRHVDELESKCNDLKTEYILLDKQNKDMRNTCAEHYKRAQRAEDRNRKLLEKIDELHELAGGAQC